MSKTVFATPYNGVKNKSISPAGKKERNTYAYKIDNQGKRHLEVTGSENVWMKIQAELEDSKIENIVKRVMAGDDSVLRPMGIFEDITNIPTNLNDSMRQIQEMRNYWMGIPRDIKAQFHNNVEEFIAAAGSPSWLKTMGYVKDEPVKTEPTNKIEEPTNQE